MQLQSARTQVPLRKEAEQQPAGAAAPPYRLTQLAGSPPLHSLADL